MTQQQTIRAVFGQLDSLPWNYAVYLPPGTPTLDTNCIVLDPDDVDPDQNIPEDAVDLGFEEGLGIADIRSIQENAQLQGRKPSADEMLRAFVYYLQNDAFIEFD